MISYRVTVLSRDSQGRDFASVHSFDSRAIAGRYADDARREDPSATVDLVAVGERGEYVPDHLPDRPAKTAGAREALQRAALALPERRDL